MAKPLPHHAEVFTHQDYDAFFALLADCGATRTLRELRRTLLDSLARRFGYRDITFFLGATVPGLFQDTEPEFIGRTQSMLDAYIDDFHRIDPFATLGTTKPFAGGPGPITLDELGAHLRDEHKDYLHRFLFRQRIHDKLVQPLVAETCVGGIGLLARESGDFGVKERVLLTLIGQYLPPMLDARIPGGGEPSWSRGLTPTQHKVARLILLGSSNQAIAAELHIGVDTVKKHVSAILRATACGSRTQFVAMALAG
ncbi:helix-turn-helix transcriptional regulator [Yinghuangia seranimata]|uniref:helix-turn-helix transcriptional regulator n=1 Tax=Yinghuangia seranimata TaxID=408067 RepID=UPI00248BA75E|nr:helix-turn-helix transcriptional regulator [Yinghuangia seranimata]MDI2130776.1 helix-turn-helix transcriptional regulator [Yinghuangia seranimata]